MKLVHLSDTHLGYTAYRALDRELGINQREADSNRRFSSAIDRILSLKPQAVLHTGDLFDSVRPSNRTIAFAVKELMRLSLAGIDVVVICGNHSSPRLRDTGNIFQLLELFPNIHPVYLGYRKIELDGVTVHAVPHCSSEDELVQNLNGARKELLERPREQSKYQVLMLHAVVSGTPGLNFSMGEFNELEVPREILGLPFDYIAVGHFHRYTQLSRNAFYAGSLERLSFNEVGQEKGFIEMDMEKSSTRFHLLETRPMLDLAALDARSLDSEALMTILESLLENHDLPGKIVRLTIENLSPSAYRALDFGRIRELTASALHFELKYRQEHIPETAPPPASLGGILSEFREFVRLQELDELDKDKICELGEKLLQESQASD